MTKYNSKWGACRNGHRHQSKREAYFCGIYTAMEKAGKISHLQQQPVFELQEKFEFHGEKIRAIKYIGDFAFREGGKFVVVDVKGVRTAVFELKLKMLKYKNYADSFEFREVK